MRVKVGDITKIKTGKLDANVASEDGEYPFFTCSREPLRISSYSYDCECVLVAGNGDLNVKYYNGKFDAYQRTYILEDNSDGRLYMPYLYLFMEGYVEELRRQAIGGVIKYIKLGNLTDALIELPSVEEQKDIVEILFKSKRILEQRESELEKLDELIKARFVEMFLNKGYEYKTIDEVTVAGTQNGFYKKGAEEDGYIPTVKMTQLFAFESMEYASGFDYVQMTNNELEKFKLTPNDLLFGRRSLVPAGAGKCRRVGNINVNMVFESSIIRITLNPEIVLPRFLQCYIESEEGDKAMNSLRSGTTVVGIKGSDLQKYKVLTPDISKQYEFIAFAEQVDKSKVAIPSEKCFR